IDKYGLSTTGSFQIIVEAGEGTQPPSPPPPGPPPVEDDTTPPVLSLPDAITAVAGQPVTFEATATDDRDDAPVVTCEPSSGSVFPAGATNVTCTATDSSGNVATGTFTVTVAEEEPEVIDTSAFDDLWARTDKPVADG